MGIKGSSPYTARARDAKGESVWMALEMGDGANG